VDKQAIRGLKERANKLLNQASSAIRYASIVHEYRHTDYPSGGMQKALQFVIQDDRQVELVMTKYYEVI